MTAGTAAADGAAREPHLGREGAPLRARAAPALTDIALAELVEAAQVCDGLAKGLRHPDWPVDAWAGLRRLSLMICERVAVGARKPAGPGRRLALTP